MIPGFNRIPGVSDLIQNKVLDRAKPLAHRPPPLVDPRCPECTFENSLCWDDQDQLCDTTASVFNGFQPVVTTPVVSGMEDPMQTPPIQRPGPHPPIMPPIDPRCPLCDQSNSLCYNPNDGQCDTTASAPFFRAFEARATMTVTPGTNDPLPSPPVDVRGLHPPVKPPGDPRCPDCNQVNRLCYNSEDGLCDTIASPVLVKDSRARETSKFNKKTGGRKQADTLKKLLQVFTMRSEQIDRLTSQE